jgi:hypothetical protein
MQTSIIHQYFTYLLSTEMLILLQLMDWEQNGKLIIHTVNFFYSAVHCLVSLSFCFQDALVLY